MDIAKEVIKKQFNKKKRNMQELKEGENMWLEAKNTHSNRFSKKLDQKRYRSFCYKLKILELTKRKNLVLELTQKNLIENSVQD